VPTKSLLVIGSALVALAGCGSSGSSSTSSSASTTRAPAASSTSTSAASAPAPASAGAAPALAADPSGMLKFDKTTLSAKAGKATISFTNSSPTPHNLTIQSSSGAVVGATPTFAGATKMLAATLKPGTYTFFCSVPGHRQAGMQGTLTVSSGGSSASTPAPSSSTTSSKASGGNGY
jgi:plastocyanin